MTDLAWFLEDPTPARRYAADLLSDAIGLRARFLDRPPEGGEAYVHHGSGSPAGSRGLSVPVGLGAPPLEVKLVGSGPPWRLNADIVDGTIAFVTDAVHAEAVKHGRDRHGRLRAAASFLAGDGSVTDPVVNRYAIRLREALASIGVDLRAQPPWPQGKRAAIGISHDVDRPDKYAILRALRMARLPPARRLPWFVARSARDLLHRLNDPHPNDFWLFDEVVAAEARLGFRSTFLFSVVPAYAAYGSENDVLYDASWPHLRRAMRRLRDEGIEIGLHASYNAYRDPARFVAERERLEDLSRGPVRGLRHHFWQTGPDVPRTLRAHEAAGFMYDSSLAYNDAIGLRRAIAWPYRPWDADEKRALRTWQLPVIALDSAACAGVTDPAVGIQRVWAGIERVVAVGGLAVLDWHVRASVPANSRYRIWGQVYLGILQRLAQRPDIWTAPLGEIAAWADDRRRQLADGR